MKRIFLSLAAALMLLPASRADEGMWLLPLLEKINSETMQNLGSRLTAEQIYSVNHSSIKDAVVQFGGGCTGELISGSGLLVTNHHCGYSSIQALSSEEHNYLEDGFWATSLEEEIPVPGLTVKFLQSMTDVTGKVRNDKAREKLIKKAEEENPYCNAQIVSFFNDNVQYLVVYKIYRDVRFVGAPPASLGKFGGETDNWMWPRQTCDFSMFRVYAGKNNEPASYSEDNVPLQPRQFLNISLKGVEEGDFVMVMGYPGSTQRYQTAAQLEDMLAINDIRIDARTVRQDVLWDEMRADDKVSLQYASKYASSSNGWKKWIGMRDAFAKLDVIGRQKEKEAELASWIEAKNSRVKKYGGAVSEIAAIMDMRARDYRAYTLLNETLMKIELLQLTRSAAADPYKDYDAEVDRKVALALVKHYLDNVDEQDRIDIDSLKVEQLFRESVFTSPEKLAAARAEGRNLSEDPARILDDEIQSKAIELYSTVSDAADALREPAKTYAAALLEWTADEPNYPDANMTCRLSYGTVKGYEPRDGVVYKYYTTLKGVIEKEEPGNYEFRVPDKLKEIYAEADYGDYANDKGELVTCFLTNLDITGGNSGSPVMDADGNLVGLAFDGNWEAMSGDVIFEPELQRCICVDIRYVLLILDKFGGAGRLLDEMNIVR
ncbi:MAG: S46 family peptidase [Bacteroidetes bacterium]|uniref:Dipeptidyl-peptidase n=1 Tax=Candidatus Cryptobacteroides avistercoris TaxID=2840758 RepID=A0A9D9NNK2_9BACT|nr:S46 family peptidase [Candidatus Cryptobacteroides avistercoris]